MIGADIQKAARLLRSEALVAIPTETVYGLAGNALSEKAVAEIFRVKNRPVFDPLIVHTDHFQKAKQFLKEVPDWASELAAHFMPGPLTLLLPKNERIPDLVTAGSELVAIRVPNHPLTLQLLALLEFPLAAPSANPFGYISPTTAQHVADQLGEKIPYILDGGPCRVGVESTIVGFVDEKITVFRKGGVAIEYLEKVVGTMSVQAHSSSNPLAPGMLKSHYAPRTPVVVGNLEELMKQHAAQSFGVISFSALF
ncbi:MAG TPA: L-threonylcarbamoyladenylate synthase, partial [Saprospiraceae bacterium]|nr:L-threonylcarbamoyladenylate synthase [Saprospiraceae bacterium]